MNDLRTGLSYGDVLLVPQRSPVDSRSDVDLSTPLTPNVELATTAAAEARDDKGADVGADEGVEALTPYVGPVATVAEEFCQGIRSGLSYCGGHGIDRARDRAAFIRVTPGAKEREGFHTDNDWEGISVDSETKRVAESSAGPAAEGDD